MMASATTRLSARVSGVLSGVFHEVHSRARRILPSWTIAIVSVVVAKTPPGTVHPEPGVQTDTYLFSKLVHSSVSQFCWYWSAELP